MQIEYKNLRCGFNHKVKNYDGEVVVFIHAEYDDKVELLNTLFTLVNMVVDDEL